MITYGLETTLAWRRRRRIIDPHSGCDSRRAIWALSICQMRAKFMMPRSREAADWPLRFQCLPLQSLCSFSQGIISRGSNPGHTSSHCWGPESSSWWWGCWTICLAFPRLANLQHSFCRRGLLRVRGADQFDIRPPYRTPYTRLDVLAGHNSLDRWSYGRNQFHRWLGRSCRGHCLHCRDGFGNRSDRHGANLGGHCRVRTRRQFARVPLFQFSSRPKSSWETAGACSSGSPLLPAACFLTRPTSERRQELSFREWH